MHPVLIDLGNFTIYSYGVMLAVAFGAGIWWAYSQAEKHQIKKNIILDLGLYLLLASLVGGRLLFVLINFKDYLNNPWQMIFSRSGFVFYGGFIFALLTGAVYLAWHKISFWKAADLIVPSVAVGEAIGRIGCFLNGCCYGKPTSLGWGVVMPGHANAIHPTQVYLSLSSLVLFCFLGLLVKKGWKMFDGQIFCWYLILHPSCRFVIEFFRGDNTPVLAQFTLAQVISSIMGICGIGLMIIKNRKKQMPALQQTFLKREGFKNEVV